MATDLGPGMKDVPRSPPSGLDGQLNGFGGLAIGSPGGGGNPPSPPGTWESAICVCPWFPTPPEQTGPLRLSAQTIHSIGFPSRKGCELRSHAAYHDASHGL